MSNDRSPGTKIEPRRPPRTPREGARACSGDADRCRGFWYPRIDAQPGWRLDVVVLEPESPFGKAAKEAAEPSDEQHADEEAALSSG
jgi:hypothetical protein